MVKDGKVTRIADDIANPNGLSLSPDEKTFYANGSAAKFVRAYDVQPDDNVTNSRMLIDMSDDKTPGITDGMKVDTKGNIWESGPGGIWIVSPQGKHLGTIFTPKLVGNLEFGDADHKTLYIAARSDVYKIHLNVAGIPRGPNASPVWADRRVSPLRAYFIWLRISSRTPEQSAI